MPDDAAIHWWLNVLEHSTMQLEYEITAGPFPVSAQVGAIDAKPTGDNSCDTTWGVLSNPPRSMKNLCAFYHMIIESPGTVIQSENLQDDHQNEYAGTVSTYSFW